MKQFVNRRKELETLRKEYSRKEAPFVVIYGRRRVGKTALIKEFCKDKRSIMFLATEENETEMHSKKPLQRHLIIRCFAKHR